MKILNFKELKDQLLDLQEDITNKKDLRGGEDLCKLMEMVKVTTTTIFLNQVFVNFVDNSQ